MVSVCVVTYNGEKYIREQIVSILSQLGNDDELIISDDGSSDSTLDILQSFSDDRIKLYGHKSIAQKYKIDYVTHNVEFALSKCTGDYIFLSDQDDIWLPTKLEQMKKCLEKVDVVLSNCKVVDADLKVLYESYFKLVHAQSGVIHNIIKNSFLGCCMAFRREVLNKVLPFPLSGVGHDLWIGIIGTMYYKIAFIEEPLLLYRKHGENVTSTIKSSNSIRFRIYYRMLIIKALLGRAFREFKL